MDRLARDVLIEALSMGRCQTPKHAKTRASTGLCLIPGCNEPAVGRGVCVCHKNAFYYQLSCKSTKREKLDFETDAIRKGLILPAGKQLSIKREESSPFAGCGSQSA